MRPRHDFQRDLSVATEEIAENRAVPSATVLPYSPAQRRSQPGDALAMEALP